MAERTSDRSDSLVESHKGYDPRLLFFYPLVALLLLVLIGGLAYQQLFKTDVHQAREKQQNQRRILMPGPRGDIYDREGRPLVKNRARFSVTLNLDELRSEFNTELRVIRKNYLATDDKDLPSYSQLRVIARYTVVQRYLDQANQILGRTSKIDAEELDRHFRQQLLLPYTLLDDLKPEEYAKLIEQLPVNSALQVYASSTRDYPYGSAAAHTLGYVSVINEIQPSENFPGTNLGTFTMPGTEGKAGLEKRFDQILQGKTGGAIYRVDPAGYRIEPPLERHVPVQGQNVTISLDIDLQLAAEKAMEESGMKGAAVALDISTGEVLTLASKPDYNLNELTPKIFAPTYAKIEEEGGWYFRPIQGIYAPGSTFKILTSIAGLRSGTIQPDSFIDCPGFYMVGNKSMPCHDRHAHGHMTLPEAIAQSCNVFFYKHGLETTAETIAAEARRFGFNVPTGIELPYESRRMNIPDPAWKRRLYDQGWFAGDTANMAIGQGYVDVTPLQMACFVASVARGQTVTKPEIIHIPKRPPQNTEPIGLSRAAYNVLMKGMIECVQVGTGKLLTNGKMLPKIDGLTAGGKTGTAQKSTDKGTLNFAWFICFAPADKPEIALAIMMEGDEIDTDTGGGRFAVPIAHAILKKWWEKRNAKPLGTAAK